MRLARNGRQGGSDLVPFWCLEDRGENEKIIRVERIVPMYPLSRDQLRYNRVIELLSLYRLALGQHRQEELLDSLLKNRTDLAGLENLLINLSPFYRRAGAGQE